jgi:uncharacterized membrane protein YidH (DUF202 family)
MSQCSNCGAELRPAANFCSSCGAAQAEAAQTEVFDPAASPSPAPADVLRQRADQLRAAPAAQTQKNIENHFIKSIIATVCCCVPFGIVGIIYATKVDAYMRTGNRAAAEDASQKANLWSNLAIGIGLVVNALVTMLTVIYQLKALNLPSL